MPVHRSTVLLVLSSANSEELPKCPPPLRWAAWKRGVMRKTSLFTASAIIKGVRKPATMPFTRKEELA